jgi:DNA-binding MarR family transcriptional regulator
MSNPVVPFETTLHVRDACLCLHAQRAARALARRFDEALRPCGLTNGQFSLLMSLNRPEPAKMAPVAALLAMDRTTLTAALKPLERRGLIEIAVDPADSRGRLLSLTANGHRVLLEAVPTWTRLHASLESDLADPQATRHDLAVLSRRDDAGVEQPGIVRRSVPPKRPSSVRARKDGGRSG